MSTKAGKRPMRPLSTREKLEAIHRVHDGESKASVARDIGVPESTLRGWCKNEDKITLLSRQSSPETDESIEHHDKKRKMDENVQPFNLSLKVANSTSLPATAGLSSYSPNSENRYTVDYSKTGNDAKAAPLDLQTKSRESVPKVPLHSSVQAQSEREKNRAELARLSIELGLNRPEMFISNAPNSNGTSLSDLSNLSLLAAQWNQLLVQQSQIQQAKKMTSPVANNVNAGCTSGGSLLTTVNQQPGKLSPVTKLPSEKISVQDSVRYWLNSSTPPHLSPNNLPQANGFPASLSTPLTNNANGNTTSPSTGMTPEQSSYLLKWYKHMIANQYANTQYSMPFQAPAPDKPILYQQLTKDKEVYNAEDLSIAASLPEDRPGAKNIQNTKARAVLDTLLLNNNDFSASKDEENGEVLSHSDAVAHGQKFLMWLETCSEPSITAMQLMQFRSLLNNVKLSAERKNGGVQMKAKVRRK